VPIYEYRCGSCGRRVEVWLRASGDQPHCPACGGSALEKLFSPAHACVSQDGRGSKTTCCGQAERCDSPPCGEGGGCRRG
jgi:putative FmdB family regulatory protein